MIRKLGKEKLPVQNDYHRPHDTWTTEPLTDGSGHRRVRSLRSKRAIFTLAVTTFTIGALLIIGASPYKNDFLAPGELCSAHAQILAGQGADRCAACHGASDRSVAMWLVDTLTGGQSIGASQSELCMKCHEQSISPDHALNPHSIAAADLKPLTDKVRPASFALNRPLVQSLSSPPQNEHGQISCSACHREHHGNESLTALTDQQCQSCHTQAFHSFETDHPEFTNWPQQRRSRIAFDHSTHAGKHFPGKSTSFDCAMCHVDGPDKNVKQLASFEQSCATCHEQQIQQSAESGIAIFALPSINTEAIEAQQLSVGTWPLAATGDFDGEFPPAMKLLLYADADAAEALDRFEARYGANFDFADVDGEDADQVADAVELVWASKRLLNEMALSGRAAIASRLTRALASDVSAEQVARLAAELDESVFQNTVRRWLPGLAAEVASRKFDGISRPTQLIASSRDASASGRFKPVKFTRAVQADEVLADNPLMDLLGGVSATRDETVESTRPVVRKAQSIAVDRLKDHGTGRKPAKKQLKLKNRLADEVVSDKLLLAVNPLSTLGEGRVIEADQLPPMDSGDPASSEVTVGSEVNAIAGRGMTQPPAISRVGWYRDDEMFRVFYRPGGHEDDGLRAWSDLIASAAASNDRPETAALFHQLLSDKGIGLCATCHTVDQQSDQSFLVNWTTKYRHPSDRSFTKFSHQPHTLQPHLRDCSGCHDMSQPISNADSFAGFDPLNAVSNFAPITKMNCVSCHREGHTDNGCTHCHRYHVGE